MIPTRVMIAGTCRTSDPDLRKRLPQLVRQLTREIAVPTGAEVTTEWQPVLASVSNDPSTVDALHRSLVDMLGPAAVVDTFTSLGAEDFAFYLDRAPGVMMRLGAMADGNRRDLHSAWFEIHEDCLEVGVKAGVASVLGLWSQPTTD